MKEIIPYTEYKQAHEDLDNGGHFFNIFTHAGDHEITPAEMQVAGKSYCKEDLGLYYEMAALDLSAEDRNKLESEFSEKLSIMLAKASPSKLSAEEFNQDSKEGQSYIITGTAKFSETASQVTSTMMMPIMMGNSMSYMPMPVTEHFQLLELVDDNGIACTVILPKSEQVPLGKRCRWGGFARQSLEESEDAASFLGARFYTLTE